MSTSDEEIRAILSDADKRLLELIASYAHSGDLVGVEAARTAAIQVRAIAISPSISETESAIADSQGTRNTLPDKQSTVNGRSKKKLRYPFFEIRNSTLCRIGWSKKKKESYTHRVPRGIVFDIVNVMATLCDSSSGPYSIEQIVSRVNTASSVSIPSYQAYAIVGFLRSRGLIEQVGRDGYQIPAGLSNKFHRAWKALGGS